MAALILLSGVSWAQTTDTTQTAPQPPASWVAFQQQEHAKSLAFFKQLNDDKQAFLKANPDVQAYLNQIRGLAQARAKAWKAAHQKTSATPS